MTDTPVRLADFLREKCAHNEYGLKYLNLERTLLFIPWPVAPRPNEELPFGFLLYHEWAVLSLQRRHFLNTEELHEPPTNQKHRFRNALARANGLKYRQDLAVEGGRVYEFVAPRKTSENSVSSPVSYRDNGQVTPRSILESTSSSQSPISYAENSSDGQNTSATLTLNGLTGHGISDMSPVADSISPVDLPAIPHDVIDEILRENSPRGQQIYDGATQEYSIDETILYPPQKEEDDAQLLIKLCFRQDEVFHFRVTNGNGCRVYFGTNVPDLSLLLQMEHRESLMRFLRFNKDAYFGPETLQQVKLPAPELYIKPGLQREKSEEILHSMERGLILCLDHVNAHQNMGIPDVHAMRLCQTRIFPVNLNANEPMCAYLPSQSLTRMQWTKVFDAGQFCSQMAASEQFLNLSSVQYPSPTFTLSLGQRPTETERPLLLVSLSVTVQRAQELIQSRFDNRALTEVCVSNLTSMDEEARVLAMKLQETLTL